VPAGQKYIGLEAVLRKNRAIAEVEPIDSIIDKMSPLSTGSSQFVAERDRVRLESGYVSYEHLLFYFAPKSESPHKMGKPGRLAGAELPASANNPPIAIGFASYRDL
ncbi:MAG: hypothetical protein AABX51_07935, partial [Nanoarchaeota archaeon]